MSDEIQQQVMCQKLCLEMSDVQFKKCDMLFCLANVITLVLKSW